jgi:hypothetical protein
MLTLRLSLALLNPELASVQSKLLVQARSMDALACGPEDLLLTWVTSHMFVLVMLT